MHTTIATTSINYMVHRVVQAIHVRPVGRFLPGTQDTRYGFIHLIVLYARASEEFRTQFLSVAVFPNTMQY